MARILITGDAGFIGSHLSWALKDFKGIDLVYNQDILTSELPEVKLVIHLAAQTDVVTSVDNPMYDAEINILGTIRLAEHYKDTLFIFASSGGAIQEKIESPYGLSKFCAEEYIKMICKNYRILRFPNIYGQGSNSVVDKFINGDVRIFGDGTATRDYVYVGDLIKAIKKSIKWPVGTYQLGSEKNYTVNDLAEATGKPFTHQKKRAGELQHSFVKNTAPNWTPEVDVISYIKARV